MSNRIYIIGVRRDQVDVRKLAAALLALARAKQTEAILDAGETTDETPHD